MRVTKNEIEQAEKFAVELGNLVDKYQQLAGGIGEIAEVLMYAAQEERRKEVQGTEPRYFPKHVSGTSFFPPKYGFKIMCCDCGLTHGFKFSIIRNRIRMAMFRDNRATAQLRRRRFNGRKP